MVILGSVILFYFLGCCVLMWIDIHEEAEWQTRAAEHEELLDELWNDESRGLRPEDVSATASAE
jgi:hypothetical protein